MWVLLLLLILIVLSAKHQSIICFLEEEQSSLEHISLAFLNHPSGFSQCKWWASKAANQVARFCHWKKDASVPAAWPAIWLRRIFLWKITTVLLSPGICLRTLPCSLPLPVSLWVHRYSLLIGTLLLGLNNPYLSFLPQLFSLSSFLSLIEFCWEAVTPLWLQLNMVDIPCLLHTFRIREERELCTNSFSSCFISSSTNMSYNPHSQCAYPHI